MRASKKVPDGEAKLKASLREVKNENLNLAKRIHELEMESEKNLKEVAHDICVDMLLAFNYLACFLFLLPNHSPDLA